MKELLPSICDSAVVDSVDAKYGIYTLGRYRIGRGVGRGGQPNEGGEQIRCEMHNGLSVMIIIGLEFDLMLFFFCLRKKV